MREAFADARQLPARFVRSLRIGRLSPRWLYVDAIRRDTRAALVVGTARSGTTKLAELLSAGRTTRLIFEPAHPYRSPLVPPDFVWGMYLSPETPDESIRRMWERAFTGQCRSSMLDQDNATRFATRRVVKCIAGTNLLPWLRSEFPHVPALHLVRHPLAVADSMCRVHDLRGRSSIPGSWGWQINDIIIELSAHGNLLDGPLSHLHDEINALVRDAEHPFDRVVIRWCLENTLALTQRRTDVPIVHYEQLFTDPETVLPQLAAHLGVPLPHRVWRTLQDPSRTDFHVEPFTNRRIENRVGSWRTRIEPERRKAALRTLRTFGLDRIYDDDDPMPLGH